MPAPAPPRRPPPRRRPLAGGRRGAQRRARRADDRARFALFAAAAGVRGLLFLPAVLGRWRMRRLLISGDVERVIGTWEGSIQRVPYRETMAPLLKATAYASYGWIEAARRALERAVRGPAWDAAIEQRLFVETLLDTFEGDRDAALRKAQALESLAHAVGGPLRASARRPAPARARGPGAGVRPREPRGRRARPRARGRARRPSSTGRCGTRPPSSRSTAAARGTCRRCSRAPRPGPTRARFTRITTSLLAQTTSYAAWRASFQSQGFGLRTTREAETRRVRFLRTEKRLSIVLGPSAEAVD